jgi:hypothetical protein
MQDHVRILGIVHIVFGLIGICVAFLMLVIFGVGTLGIAGAAAQEDPEALVAIPIVAAILSFVVFFIALLSLPGILAGWGLLNYKPWARILAIVLSALNLLSVPIGTVIGAYGLWVLLNTETERLFLSPPAKPTPPVVS